MTTRSYSLGILGLILSVPLLLAQPTPQDESAARRARAERARQRQQEFYQTRAYPMGTIPSGARLSGLREMERMIAQEQKLHPHATGPAWTLIGPRPTNVLGEASNNGGSPYAAGRVAALAVDRRNANVAYMGASGGGVWKTTDGGQNWTPVTDDQATLSIGSIALAPSNPDVVYVGTGEQNNSGDSYYGAGVLKSTDGGATWTQISGPFVGPFSSSRLSGGGARIGGMAVHPADPNIVLAAVDRASTTLSGIYRTADGGATWTLVLSGAVGTDAVFNPADGTVAYAALGSAGGSARNGLYKSSDAGVTWTLSGGAGATALPTAGIGRISLAIAPSAPNTVLAGIASSNGATLLGLYKTTDGAQTWARLLAPDYCTPQCAYNNTIRVSPVNPNVVVAAGLPPYRSLDGGVTWASIVIGGNGVNAHTDHHALAFAADGSRLYDGSDGGVFSTSNVTVSAAASVAWTNLNATLAITEFSTNVSVHPADPRIAYAGTQDNGTQLYSGSLTWDQVVGGDGGSTAIDPAIPTIWYGAFQGPQIYKLSGLTSISSLVTAPFVDVSSILWNGIVLTDRITSYPPLVMNPSNPTWLYFCSQRLYQSYDGAGTWALLSPDMTGGTGVISAIGVSPASPRAVAVGTSDGKVQVNDNAGPGGYNTWVDRSKGLPGRSVAQIRFDPQSPTTFYVALSGFSGFLTDDKAGHVFKTTDFGATWTDISGSLPNIPANDIVVDPDLPGTIYLATDLGVFVSSDDGQNWATLSNGLPRVLVRALNLHRPSRTLRAVTYGRSMWDLSVPLSGASRAPRIDSYAPTALSAAAGPITVTVTGSNFVSNSAIRWNGADRATTFVNATTLRLTLSAADLAKSGRATLLVFNPVAGGGLSNSVNAPIGPAPAVTSSSMALTANPAAGGVLVPGSLATLYGSSLAAETVTAGAPPLPYTLGGVTVEVNGFPAPLSFVSPGQINFQTPWEMEGYSRATVTVINGTLSTSVPVVIAFALPALFSTNGAGTGQGAITISGPEVLAAPAGRFPGSRPVKRGESLAIYCTGLGPVSRIQGDGQIKPTTTGPAISQIPNVTIGGLSANVLFSGLTPGAVGLYQVNIQVPDGTPLGDAVPVVVSMKGAVSNTVTVAVQSQ